MKRSIRLSVWFFGLAASLVSTPATAQFGFLFGPSVEVISTSDLNELLQKQQSLEDQAKRSESEPPVPAFVVVDVRSDSEINVSVIPGAITKAKFEEQPQRYRDRLVIPYCTVGGRSGTYAKQLIAKGWKVKNYEGSILKWVDAGLPLITLAGESTHRVHTYSDRYSVPSKYERVTK